MHTLYNIKTKEDITFPSTIHELSPKQYLAYLKLMYKAEIRSIPIKDLRVALLKIVSPIHFGTSYLKMDKEEKSEMWESIYALSEKMDSFFDIEEMEGKLSYRPHLKCATNLLPCWKDYVGPDDMLNNITWGEFISCMNLLNVYKQAMESEDMQQADNILSELFFTLYKPTEEQKRVAVPIYIRMHALYFFTYVFELISTTPIDIHGNEIDFSIIFSNKGSGSNDNRIGWNGLVFAIAESGVFGKTSDVHQESFWSVMLYLYKCAFDAEQLKSKTK